jgi:hypothetical protein
MSRQTLSGSPVAKGPASSRFGSEFRRVTRELESVTRENLRQADPIVEQLKQCPEAFKAGEMISKMLDSLKYSQGNDPAADRYLPPAGTVIPPLA